MSIDYIVASLPPLAFGEKAPLSWEAFADACGGADGPVFKALVGDIERGPWRDAETQLRNACAEARTGSREHARPAKGCSLYWKGRVLACFAEKDVAKRDELIDRTWWDAAGELASPSSPLGRGALAAYAVRLRIALKRSAISTESGGAALDRLTAGTEMDFK